MTETTNQPKTSNHLLGMGEVAAGATLLVAPIAFIAIAAGGFCYLTYKKYQENAAKAKEEQKTVFQQLVGAAAMAFGTVISSYTILGAAIMTGAGLAQGMSGNAASFDMVHGAILGTAVHIGLPVLAGAMILEGSYKAVTGKDCDVVKSAVTYIGKGIKRVTDYVVGTSDQKSTEQVTAKTAEDVKQQVSKKALEVAIEHRSTLAKIGSFLGKIIPHTGSNTKPDSSIRATSKKDDKGKST